MVATFIQRLSIGLAVLAASAFSASAQYNVASGGVIGAEVSQQVSSQVASTIAAGISGGGASGGFGGPSDSSAYAPSGKAIAEIPVTRYFEGGNRGTSAGAKSMKTGVWVLGSYSYIENDLNSSTAYDGNIFALAGGADYRLTRRVTAGLTLSLEDVDIDTSFNSGTVETTGYGFSPYAVFTLNNRITADINAGYTDLSTDTTRQGGVTGEYDSDRYTASANLKIRHSIDKIFLNGSVGFLYINETQDAYTESDGTLVPQLDISIGQGRLSATVGYNYGKYKPYLTAQLQHEFWAPSASIIASGADAGASTGGDTSGYVLGGGVAFALSDVMSGTISASTTEGREAFSLYSISGRIRYQF